MIARVERGDVSLGTGKRHHGGKDAYLRASPFRSKIHLFSRLVPRANFLERRSETWTRVVPTGYGENQNERKLHVDAAAVRAREIYVDRMARQQSLQVAWEKDQMCAHNAHNNCNAV